MPGVRKGGVSCDPSFWRYNMLTGHFGKRGWSGLL
jgi:hypothetical protein